MKIARRRVPTTQQAFVFAPKKQSKVSSHAWQSHKVTLCQSAITTYSPQETSNSTASLLSSVFSYPKKKKKTVVSTLWKPHQMFPHTIDFMHMKPKQCLTQICRSLSLALLKIKKLEDECVKGRDGNKKMIFWEKFSTNGQRKWDLRISDGRERSFREGIKGWNNFLQNGFRLSLVFLDGGENLMLCIHMIIVVESLRVT